MIANVHRLEQLQSFEKVYAPFAGVITARNTDIGALINAGAGGAPQELFHMAAVNKLRVYVAVPEVDAQAAQTGAKATLTLDEFPGEDFPGHHRPQLRFDRSRLAHIERRSGRQQPAGPHQDRCLCLRASQASPVAATPQNRSTIPANTLLFRSEGLRVAVVRKAVPNWFRSPSAVTLELRLKWSPALSQQTG